MCGEMPDYCEHCKQDVQAGRACSCVKRKVKAADEPSIIDVLSLDYALSGTGE